MRRFFANIGRVLLLLLIALTAFGYLSSGLDEGNAAAEAKARLDEAPPIAVRPPAEELAETLTAINQCFADQWQSAGVDVASPAPWLAVGRRISLAMVGTGMSLQEIRELEAVPESQRVGTYLERLLAEPRHHDYWAERFTRVYVGNENGPFISFRRRRFRSWLSDSFAANRPYDLLVRNLVTAEGLWTDRPEVNFLTVTIDSNEPGQPDPIRMAARTTRAFLGLRIDCMQCHDDFMGNVSLGDGDQLRPGTQQDFHSLAAFYSTARLNGLQGIRTEEHPYEYQFLNQDEQTIVEPTVPYAEHLLPADGKPRERLAAWITHPENKQAARAAVSRVWALLFGQSITAAVDNIPLDAEVHPVIDLLTDDFVKHQFDLRRLIRLIVLSRPYQLDSAADFVITAVHEQAWSVFPLVRLRPEQVAGSVIQAARVKTIDRDSALLIQLMKFGGVNDFVKQYGDIGEDEFDQDNVTITQRLLMLNGKLVDEYSDKNPVLNASSHIAMFAANDAEAIDTIYLCVLNRRPDAEEKSMYTTRLSASQNREATIEDLFWVLLNSSELAWNH